MSLYIGVRDRAMLLLGACTCFRGDNTRSLLWSDLFSRDVPVPEIGLDANLTVSKRLVDLFLHNQAHIDSD